MWYDGIQERFQQLLLIPVFRRAGDDCLLRRQNDAVLPIQPVRAVRIVLSTPEQVAVAVFLVFDLLAPAFAHPIGVKQLFSLPLPALLIEQSQLVQLWQRQQQPRCAEAPFDSSRKMMSTIHRTDNGFIQYTKGAPDALLSRCTVFEFKPLAAADVERGVRNAVQRLSEGEQVPVCMDEDACAYLAESAGGDLRKALGCLDFAVTAAPVENGEKRITLDMIRQVTRRTAMRYDREGDDHYDIVSAYQKSMRGSDPDAALHYLARLLEAGDLPSACRRLMVCACEDVGLAYPQIIPIVKAAVDAANMLGLPEARIPLADAVILVATSPKSNTGEAAIDRALADVRAGRSGPIPRQLQNKHYDGADAAVKGQHYQYAHDFANHWVDQQYLPDAIRDRQYYQFGDNKNEQAAAAYWQRIKGDKFKK